MTIFGNGRGSAGREPGRKGATRTRAATARSKEPSRREDRLPEPGPGRSNRPAEVSRPARRRALAQLGTGPVERGRPVNGPARQGDTVEAGPGGTRMRRLLRVERGSAPAVLRLAERSRVEGSRCAAAGARVGCSRSRKGLARPRPDAATRRPRSKVHARPPSASQLDAACPARSEGAPTDKRRRASAGRIIGVGLLCFLIWLLFDANQLYHSAQAGQIGVRRTVAVSILRPIAAVVECPADLRAGQRGRHGARAMRDRWGPGMRRHRRRLEHHVLPPSRPPRRPRPPPVIVVGHRSTG